LDIPSITIRRGSLAFWAVCVGIIRIVTAVQLGREFKVAQLMMVSGALLMLFGVLVLLGLNGFGFGIWPLASGLVLVAFAFRVRNLRGSGAAGR
jgi:uncharacterized membrane protein HdeD (DUF308 family)